MSVSGLVDKTVAICRRDVLTAIRYRSGFLLTAAGAAAELAAFYYLARAIGPGFRPNGVEYFPFLVVGTGFYTFLIMGIHSFLETVQESQQAGTLEVLMTTATPPPVLVVLSAMSAFFRQAAQFLLYLFAGIMIFHGSLPAPGIAGSLVIFLLSLVIAIAIGMMAAALQLAIQKGSAILWLLGSGAWLMTGTLFPVANLPKPLRLISDFIPITHSLDGMRLALLQGASVLTLSREIGILALFCLALLPLSLVLFSWSLNRARREGTLSCY
jgi:ABC-2 type transport system permease protein